MKAFTRSQRNSQSMTSQRTNACSSDLLLRFRPGNDQQERALLDGLNVVNNATVDGEQLSCGNFDSSLGQVQPHVSTKRQNCKPCIRLVPLQARVGLHRDQHDAQVGIFHQRPRTPAGLRLPRILFPEVSHFIRN